MEIIFAPKALNDLKYWKSSGNTKIQKKITELLQAIASDLFSGVGKPELFKHEFSGCWSRRINREHRIIYAVTDSAVEIFSLKDHY